MISRRGFALRWRIAVLSSLAIALLSISASAIAYWVVRSNLIGYVDSSLRADAARILEIYTLGRSDPTQMSTGGVVVQLYDLRGNLLIASEDAFRTHALPSELVMFTAERQGIHEWQGSFEGRPVRAALIPGPNGLGVIAVVMQTGFIGSALRELARTLMLTTALLIVLSSIIGYLVAAAAMRPITQLAKLAARLDTNHLTPIPYRGPADEVGQLSGVLNDLITRLKTSMDAQRSFLAETSHELRTPLTSLQGFLDRAARRANPEVERELSDARRIARSMTRLVSDILQLSRGELVREYIPHLLDPYNDIVKPVAEEFPGVRLSGSPGSILLGDPERLRQVVRNLTSNAVRAAGAAEKVVLSVCETPSDIVLEVCDSGPGIAPEVLPRIFDKFYKGAGGGAGLGLAIVKQIADVHQGKISVESEVGKGSRFVMRLPAFSDENSEA